MQRYNQKIAEPNSTEECSKWSDTSVLNVGILGYSSSGALAIQANYEYEEYEEENSTQRLS